MNGDEFKRIEQLFLQACQLPESERRAWLDDACRADSAIRSAVEDLLARDQLSSQLLDSGRHGAIGSEVIRQIVAMPTASGPLDARSSLMIPESIGSIRMIRELGRGGMGVVWLGHDDLLDRDVAVKFLIGMIAAPDDPAFARFLDGARAAAAVRHAGLAAVHQVNLVQSVPVLVMEYINGPTLAEVIHRAGPLNVQDTLAIIGACVKPIAELHDRGIVHRDIKPGNIMFNAAGEVFVTDFGLACSRVPLGAAINVGALAGTPAYMAPEMFEGDVSTRSDVYALGATMFEMLTGQPPYAGSVQELQDRHAREPLPIERLHSVHVPQPVIDLIERAMNKNPMFRLKSARHVAMGLEAAAKAANVRDVPAAHVSALVTRLGQQPAASIEDSASPKSSTYHEELSRLSTSKRADAKVRAESGMSPSPPAPLGPGFIELEVPCIKCEYVLKGVAADGRCPECGTAVEESLRHGRLHFADQNWLEGLWRGCRLVRSALWTILSAWMLLPIGGTLNNFILSRANRIPIEWIEWCMTAFLPVGCVLLTRGVWLSTAREPGIDEPARIRGCRWAIRLLLIPASWLILGIVVFMLVAGVSTASWVALSVIALTYFAGLGLLIWLTTTIALRIPTLSLAYRARRTLALAAILMTALAVIASLFDVVFLLAPTPLLGLFAAVSLLRESSRSLRHVVEIASKGDRFRPGYMSASAATFHSRAPVDTHINIDIPCFGCEYVLRSLAVDGKCPECGIAVAESLRPDRLYLADPSWLRQIARGCLFGRLSIWSVWIATLALLVFGTPLTAHWIDPDLRATLALVALVSGLLAATSLNAASVWFVIAREPQPCNLSAFPLRSVAWSVCGGASAALVLTAFTGGQTRSILVGLAGALLLLSFLTMCWRLSGIVRRIPRHDLVGGVRTATRILIGSLLVGSVLALWPGSPPPASSGILMSTCIFVPAAMLVKIGRLLRGHQRAIETVVRTLVLREPA